MQIAIDAGKREVLNVVSRRPRRIILMQVAILASVVSAFSDVCTNLSVDHRANW
jgi:hypothetical protein